VANTLLAHSGRGGGRGVTEAAAEIARAAAKSWLAPLLDSACDRLAFVLGNLYDLALERNHSRDAECEKLFNFLFTILLQLLVYLTLLPTQSWDYNFNRFSVVSLSLFKVT
jgi:hypothetical protein